MRKLVLGLLLAVCSFVSVPAPAATLYISDQFTVPLRRGPSNSHKILHAGLPSGTALEVLGEDAAAGFTQVRTQTGTEGWIQTQYLTDQPIARSQLAAATRRVESLESQLKTLRDSYQETRGARAQSDTRASDLSKQTEKLQAELAEVRRISATSIANYEENRQLKASNQELQTQVTQLTDQVRQLERNVMLRWLLAGGGLVLLGLLLGAWIKSRPKRSSWA
ncbi:MAG TPA: TIGR04211 family SH3 domain-containing protein [Steroidobacteraceae bacterium]|nr:TIGR04211 family SH3 domain-containing protein [Steroidobacteraceae bacterium]